MRYQGFLHSRKAGMLEGDGDGSDRKMIWTLLRLALRFAFYLGSLSSRPTSWSRTNI
jgi:hypothetical protein